MLTQLSAFVGVSAVVICTPGPDTALTIRNTLSGGRRCGVMTALGVATGLATWSLAASAGVASLLRASEPAFLALRLAGGAYLVFLGVQTLRAAVSGRVERARRAARGGARVRLRTAYRQGLLSNLSNPKIGAFFTSLLPQFGPSGHASFAMLMLLGGIFCLLTLTWLTAYAAAVSHARRLLSRPLVRRAIDAITGVVLIAFGARVAAARR